jgi:phytoene dehydrogenase-like protein
VIYLSSNEIDVIVIGAGIGGLSVANFLAKHGKKVLVFEKHDKPGGYLTSFTRKGFQFDSSVFHLTELGENQTIPNFIKYWGGDISAEKVHYNFRIFVGKNEYILTSLNAVTELKDYFPQEKEAIDHFFILTNKMFSEITQEGPPKAPFDMSFFEKIRFGIQSLRTRPTFMKYARKNGVETLSKMFTNPDLASLIYSYYPIPSLVFMSHVYGWYNMLQDENYYPVGGMQVIPDVMCKTLEKNGGSIQLKTEITKILTKDNKAIGVECQYGRQFFAKEIISNASVHHTLDVLLKGNTKMNPLRKQISRKDIFTSVMLLFVGISEDYDFGETNFAIILDEDSLFQSFESVNPDNCPILLIALPKAEGQKGHSLLVGVFLPYQFSNNWETRETKDRGKKYRELKEKVAKKTIERLTAKFGKQFKEAIVYQNASTPLTLERYTNNPKGSIMGWELDTKNYAKFLPQTTPLENLYLVGHWVFPGGGVPGVFASGYYLAKKLLAKEDIDLEKDFAEKMNELN